MKKTFVGIFILVSLLNIISTDNLSAQNLKPEYVISKDNGRIILAYKVFEDFLNSGKTKRSQPDQN